MIITFGGNTQLLEVLLSSDVEFVIVGGVAVYYYNSSREFDDLDIMINPTVDNAQKLITALTEIGLNVPYTAEAIAKPKVQIPLKNAHYADVVTPEVGMDFEKMKGSAEHGIVNGVNVMVVSREILKTMKNTDRPKDISDVQLLAKHHA